MATTARMTGEDDDDSNDDDSYDDSDDGEDDSNDGRNGDSVGGGGGEIGRDVGGEVGGVVGGEISGVVGGCVLCLALTYRRNRTDMFWNTSGHTGHTIPHPGHLLFAFLLFAKGFLAVVSQIVFSNLSPIAK
jgi:hypothetical protein